MAVRPTDPEGEEYICEECSDTEGRVPAILRRPHEPTQAEIDEHMCCHIPYRNWCPHCVRGRGRNAAHKALAAEQGHAIDTHAMDYCFLGQVQDTTVPVLVIRHLRTRYCAATVVPEKGANDWVEKWLQDFIKLVGIKRFIYKTDQEHSITCLKANVIEKLGSAYEITAEESPVGESQANGAIERAIQSVEGITRTLKDAVEADHGTELDSGHPVIPWLVSHGASLLNHCEVGVDGRTAYERLRGKRSRRELVPIGECVFFLPTGRRRKEQGKLAVKWLDGVYLGMHDGTSEEYIGLLDGTGVVKARAVKRKPAAQRYNKEELNKVRGVPWRPTVNADDPIPRVHVAIPLREEEVDVPDQPRARQEAEGPQQPRRLYIRANVELTRHGYTRGCPGCEAVIHGRRPLGHTEACRRRIETAMAQDEAERKRVEAALKRQEDFRAGMAGGKRRGEHPGVHAQGEGAVRAQPKLRPAAGQAQRPDAGSPAPADQRPDAGVPAPMDQGAGTSAPGQPGPSTTGQPNAGSSASAAQGARSHFGSVQPAPAATTAAAAPSGTSASSSSTGMAVDPAQGRKREADTPPERMEEEAERTRDVGYIVSIDRSLNALGVVEPHEHQVPSRKNLELNQLNINSYVENFDHHVSEVFNPGRFLDGASARGLSTGYAFDMTQLDPDDGEPWDMNNEAKRNKAREKLKTDRPLLLIGSPMCKAFSSLMALNVGKMDPAKVRGIIAEGVKHLKFCFELYAEQHAQGRYFIHEHPHGAWSWFLDFVIDLMGRDGVQYVRGDQCRYNQWTVDFDGTAQLAMKPTGWLTNSEHIAEAVGLRCNRNVPGEHWHRHVPLIGGRAKKTEQYPPALVAAILDGFVRQLRRDGHAVEGDVGLVACEEAFQTEHSTHLGGRTRAAPLRTSGRLGNRTRAAPLQALGEEQSSTERLGPDGRREPIEGHATGDDYDDYSYAEFFDEISGEALPPELVRAARKEELEYVKQMNVYTEVPVEECIRSTGRKPISVKWVDVDKGDKENRNVRSRIVARELKATDPGREGVFAGTPPLEALKFLLSEAMTEGKNYKKKKVSFVDISRAHFHSPVTRDIFVELPPEEARPGYCARLNKAMYGTRDAAAAWEAHYTQVMLSMGFIPGRFSAQTFKHETRDLMCYVHGDDFVCLGSQEDLDWYHAQLQAHLVVKIRGVLGPDPADTHEIVCLNRIVRWCTDAAGHERIEYECDPRHQQLVVEHLGLAAQRTKPVTTPGVKGDTGDNDDSELNRQGSALYRSICMRINYMAADRPDLQFAAKEAARHMARPTTAAMTQLKRIGRYLLHAPRSVQVFRRQMFCNTLDIYVDSNHAGCLRTRRSTTGTAMMRGTHTLRTSSSTQSVVTLSSGESEFLALVKGSSIGLGARAMCADMGVDLRVHVRLHTDSTAAKGIVTRKGVGKVRHLHTPLLWVQDKVANGDLSVHKTPGPTNAADLGTKFVTAEDIARHMATLGFESHTGRSSLALKAAGA